MKLTEHKLFGPLMLTVVAVSLMGVGGWYTHKALSDQPWGEVYTPPEWTRSAYEELQKCVGHRAVVKYEDITWMVGDGMIPAVHSNGLDSSLGAFDVFTNTLRINREFQNSEPAIRHEMMHAVLDLGGHPEYAFNETCGTIFR